MRSAREDEDDFPDAPSAEWPSVARVLKAATALPPAAQPGNCNEELLSLALSVAAGAELYGKVVYLAPLAAEVARQVMLFEPFDGSNERGALIAARAFLGANGKMCVAADDTLAAALSDPGDGLSAAIQSGLRDLSR